MEYLHKRENQWEAGSQIRLTYRLLKPHFFHFPPMLQNSTLGQVLIQNWRISISVDIVTNGNGPNPSSR
jgi:hypothetical protein